MADNQRWITPPEVFDPLNSEFLFDLDAAADSETSRLPRFLDDALSAEPWRGRSIWLNPPYGKMLDPFVRRASKEGLTRTIVALVPMRCRASWWHECIVGVADEIRFVRRRIQFLRPDGSRPELTPTQDSVVIVWRPGFSRCLVSSFYQQFGAERDRILVNPNIDSPMS